MSGEWDPLSDVFVTQNTFSEATTLNVSDINSDFEELLNGSISSVSFDITLQGDKNHVDTVGNSTSDEELLRESQNLEQEFDQMNSSADDEQMLASQQIEKENDQTATKRFGKPLSVSENQNLENLAKNKHTEKKSQWEVRIFDTWQRERDGFESELGSKLLSLSDEDLNRTLSLFVTEVRNQRGGQYNGNTIHEILISMQRFMRQSGRDVHLTTDFAFRGLRTILDAKMKSLAQAGIGMHRRRANVITPQEEDALWERGLLGDDTPEKLLETVFYLNGIKFCLRGGEEYCALKVGEFSNFCVVTRNNKKQLVYSEGVSKTNSGGLKHKRLSGKVISVDINEENPARCPVRLHQKYMSLRPVGCDDFYLRPLKYPKPNQWYSAAPIGRHVLSGVVKRLCARAGFEGFYTNHSLRATTATRLYESGLDEQLIAERTGHRSTAIRAYKRTSEGMLKSVDDVVQRKTPATVTSATSSPTTHVSDTTDPKTSRRQLFKS